MLTRTGIAPIGLAAIVTGAAGPAAVAQIPTYHVESRWAPVEPLVNGATRITLTLQARAIYDGPFPADVWETDYGNYNIFSMGYGPAGASQPSTITRTASIGTTALNRGAWGPYHIDPGEGEAPFDWTVRGAAPGTQLAPGSPIFRRGFRFFNNFTDALDSPTGNGVGGDLANGAFDAAGNLTGFNLIRDDFQATVRQQRHDFDPGAGLGWMDIYRIDLLDAAGMAFDLGGSPAYTVTFNGWLRAAGVSQRVGSMYVMTGGASVHSTASFNVYYVPGPGAGVGLVVPGVGLAWGRRRGREM